MSRTRKLIRNLALFFGAVVLILFLTGYHLSARAAFRDLEEAAQFERGEIVYQKRHDGSVYFLSISGDWAAMGVVEKTLCFSKGFPPFTNFFDFQDKVAPRFYWLSFKGKSSGASWDLVPDSEDPVGFVLLSLPYVENKPYSPTDFHQCFGVLRDPSVAEVEITLADGRTFSQSGFYGGKAFLFLFDYEELSDSDKILTSLRALDRDGGLLYEWPSHDDSL